MKISNLTIKNYKQFKDLSLDLTYPIGHEKEGQPLEKICIIGQSGTGKTNLLDIIKKSTVDFSKNKSYKPFAKFNGNETDEKFIQSNFKTKSDVETKVLFLENESKIEYISENDILFNENEKSYFVGTKEYSKINNKETSENNNDSKKQMSKSDQVLLDKLTNAKVELTLEQTNEDRSSAYLRTINSFSLGSYAGVQIEKTSSEKLRDINDAINQLESRNFKKNTIDKSIINLKKKSFISKYIININDSTEISWETMRLRAINYQILRTQYNESLSNKLLDDDTYSKENYRSDFSNWEEKNENILDKISSDINIILKKFNLELLKIDENQKNYNSLMVKDLSNDTVIEYDDLSTGTKNLLSTFIPLKSFSPKDSIILIDEPEMSFYPDIQKKLVDLYMNVGENNQLIVATHSPIIASNFEPWEIIELKFNDENQIYRDKYFEGENHIENYMLDPRMLTWTSILTNIFDLDENSNFTYREKKLMEYASLKEEIKNTSNKEEKKQKFEKLKKLIILLGLSDNETDI